jgi:hypothetical protein
MVRLLVCLSALWLVACAAPPQPGQSVGQLMQQRGMPTARYSMPNGVTRLEFATGPFGRETWMVDVDAGQQVLAAQQVLNEASFAEFQRHAPGMTRDELLRTLGRPGERRSGGWQGGQVWAWRYPTNDCLWFQASIGDDGIVRDGAYGIDPACDTRNDGRSHR